MKTKVFNEEVILCEDAVAQVDAAYVTMLKKKAAPNARRRIRLCAHRSPEDKVHEMLIVHARDTYVRPHKHLGKSESFHIIEGSCDVFLFDEKGEITRKIEMGEYGSGRCFFYRLSEPMYHSLVIHTDVLVFHETTSGPFRREETVFAPWAPEESDAGESRKLMERMSAFRGA